MIDLILDPLHTLPPQSKHTNPFLSRTSLYHGLPKSQKRRPEVEDKRAQTRRQHDRQGRSHRGKSRGYRFRGVVSRRSFSGCACLRIRLGINVPIVLTFFVPRSEQSLAGTTPPEHKAPCENSQCKHCGRGLGNYPADVPPNNDNPFSGL